MDFRDYLQFMTEHDASDLYLTAGAAPSMKVHGQLCHVHNERLTGNEIKEMAYSAMNEKQIKEFENSLEMNLAISEKDVGRFRVNIFQQRNTTAMVIRNIKIVIPTAESLGIPDVLKKAVMQKRGLILFVGATGAGKSSSLAALIDYRNINSAGHIITIEDPIEFVHQHKQSIISQREVGVDTESYTVALKNTLRQAPDVILIGEIRSAETMQQALTFAETGHLCLSTLHANNSNQAMERVISFFTEDARHRLLLDLSLNLVAIVSQRLVSTTDGKRTAAFEILLGTPLACDLIKRGDVSALKEIIQKSNHLGMQTFDDSLYQLYKGGRITMESALENADSQQNLRIRLTLEKGADESEAGNLSLQPTDAETKNVNQTMMERIKVKKGEIKSE